MECKLLNLEKHNGFEPMVAPTFKITLTGFYLLDGQWVSAKSNPFSIKISTSLHKCGLKILGQDIKPENFFVALTGWWLTNGERTETSDLYQCSTRRKAEGFVTAKSFASGEAMFKNIR